MKAGLEDCPGSLLLLSSEMNLSMRLWQWEPLVPLVATVPCPERQPEAQMYTAVRVDMERGAFWGWIWIVFKALVCLQEVDLGFEL